MTDRKIVLGGGDGPVTKGPGSAAPTPEVRVLWEGEADGETYRVYADQYDSNQPFVARLVGGKWWALDADDDYAYSWDLAAHLARLLAAAEARAVSAEGERDAERDHINEAVWKLQGECAEHWQRLARIKDAARRLQRAADAVNAVFDASGDKRQALNDASHALDEALRDSPSGKPTALEAAAHSLMQGPTATNICTPEGRSLYPEMIGVSLEKLDKLREAEQEARGK